MMKPKTPPYAKLFNDNKEQASEAKRVWNEVVFELIEKELLTKARVRIADRYARACAEYSALWNEVRKESPIKSGPNGGDYINLKWSIVEKLNERLMKFESQLQLDLRNSTEAPKSPASTTTKADDYI